MALPPGLLELALAAAAGLLAGVVSGAFGVGGGVVAVPAAIWIADLPFHEAKAAALLVIVFGSTMGLARHHKAGAVRWRMGLELAGGGVIGAVLSSIVAEDVSGTVLGRAFGVLLLLVALRMALPQPRSHVARTPWIALPAIGFAAGLLTGFFGVGGGVAMVPAMVFLGVPIHSAVATSLVAVIANGLVAAGTQAALGYTGAMLTVGVPLAAGAFLGGRLGARWAIGSSSVVLRRAFAVFLALVGLRFLL